MPGTNLAVNFIGKNNLSKTTAVMTRDLKNMQNTVRSVGNSLDKVFGSIGVTLGVAALANTLKNATKAASDDRKSQGLLANALRNTVGATSEAIAGAERYISKTQLQTSVLDDELRPALATAVRATGSLSKGQDLLNVALDVSAGTGKDLTVVTKAIARAQSGQLGGLQKLIPGIKATDDIMGELNKQFKGSAETAANLDPYTRLQVVFNDLQEQIGFALLPALEEFTKFIVSPEGQKNLQQMIKLFVDLGKGIVETTKFLIDNLGMVKAIVAALVVLRVGWGLSSAAVSMYLAVTKNAVVATKALKVALVTTGIGAVAVAVGLLAESWLNASEAQDQYQMDPFAVGGDNSVEMFRVQNIRDLIPYESDAWMELGYETYGAYLVAMKEKFEAAQVVATTQSDKIKAILAKKAEEIKRTAEKFRDSIGLAFGTFGKDENSVFNVDIVIAKLKRMVDAAKGFAGNLEKLRKGGAGKDVISEIVGMGPAQGNIVAKGLLQSGKLSEYLGLRGSLYKTGTQVGSIQANSSEKTYNLNINKANVSAEDIIKAIQKFEKTNGRKVFSN